MRSFFYVTLVLTVVLLLGCPFQGGKGKSGEDFLELSTSVDNAEITIGDIFHFTVSLRYPEGSKVELPEIGRLLSLFEIRDFVSQEPRKLGSRQLERRTSYTLSTFTTGEFTIPAMTFTYTTPEGVRGEIRSEPIDIFVKSVLPGEASDIRDIRFPALMRVRYNRWLVLGLPIAGAAVTLSAAYLVIRQRRKRRRGPLVDSAFKLSPHEAAYAELKALCNSTLLKEGKVKEFYVRLSEILKKYIALRFRIDTLERTTGEILEEIKSVRFPAEAEKPVRDFFYDCDLVKFAKYDPKNGENEKIIGDAYRIVDMTKQVESHGGTEDERLKPAATA
jgi:hypothetical protein